MFFISLYGAPLAKRASYFVQHSFLFGADGAVNYDYVVIINFVNNWFKMYFQWGTHKTLLSSIIYVQCVTKETCEYTTDLCDKILFLS